VVPEDCPVVWLSAEFVDEELLPFAKLGEFKAGWFRREAAGPDASGAFCVVGAVLD